MRALLKLYSLTSNDFVFYQYLEFDINIKENEIFNYKEAHYESLKENEKIEFNNLSLNLGKYICVATHTESNDYWGELRHLFLKPLVE